MHCLNTHFPFKHFHWLCFRVGSGNNDQIGSFQRAGADTFREMSVIADEYADDIIAGADKRAFLMEHAKVILDDKAIESLAQL